METCSLNLKYKLLTAALFCFSKDYGIGSYNESLKPLSYTVDVLFIHSYIHTSTHTYFFQGIYFVLCSLYESLPLILPKSVGC